MPAALASQLDQLRDLMRERGLTTRAAAVNDSSVSEEDRSFEAVVSTETRAFIIDWERYEIIEEILVARGGSFPAHTPLLENHQRWSTLDVIGSAVDYRREGDKWLARGIVATPVGEDDPVERIWQRVKERHIRAVSIGYQVDDYVDIPPGKRQTVDGKVYVAKPDYTLRISTKWRGFELSLTPIGADSMALIRSRTGQRRPQKRSYFR